ISLTEQIELHPNYQPPGDAKIVRDTQGEILGYKMPDGLEFSLGKDTDFQKMMEEKTPLEFKGEPKTTYDHYLKTLSDQVAWRNAVPHVTRQADRPWENTRMGKIKYLVHDSFPSALLLFDSFIQEIPPGGSSGKHRHVSEEVLKILDGRGYDIQDGQRYDWEAEDVVHIPVNTVHQHFNADPQKTARFVSFQSRLFHHVGHGGIEHFEDAPDYKP
ncbi:MAG: cupin domain-containing protein, partial [Dehalococcoidia bacterium]